MTWHSMRVSGRWKEEEAPGIDTMEVRFRGGGTSDILMVMKGVKGQYW